MSHIQQALLHKVFTSSARVSRRSRLLTVVRALPTVSAISRWLKPNSSWKRCKAIALINRVQVLALNVFD